MKLSNEIIQFANGNTDFYEAATRYFQFKNEQTSENTEKLNKAFFAEIERKSSVTREGMDASAWANHPSVTWAAMAVIDATINAIIPVTILPQIGEFADMRTVGVGDIVKFRVKPKQFYTVSVSGRGERVTFRQKHYDADVVVTPVEHIVTVYTDLYRVLAGLEDVAEFLRLVVVSVEQSLYADILNALTAGLSGISDTALNVTGAFDMKTLLKMCQTIQVRNGGVKPIITGSAPALMNVIPDSSLGYRMNVDGNGGSINLIKDVMGYDVMPLAPAAGRDGNLVLADNEIYVVSPAQDKLVKAVMSTTMTNTNQHFDNADITSNFTYRKAWGAEYISAATAGIYTIQ